MLEFFASLLDNTSFMPHGHCYLWQPGVLWLNVASDLLIALAYFSIPIALVTFVRKRKDLSFNWVFRMFAAFIFACGMTHLMEIWTTWHPDYVLQGVLKFLTAMISCLTAFLLWPLMPKALALPSPDDLKRANEDLKAEIVVRKRAEAELLEAKKDLEMRVQQRTSELRRANKMKDEFLATLSHELRTPLNVIVGYSDLLKMEMPSDPAVVEAINAISRNAHIQAELINDLLDVSRIITGKIQLDIQLVDPSSLIESALQSVQLSALAKKVKIETSFDKVTGLILGDATRLQQVFWNLFSNAIKFSPKSSTIRIASRRIDSKVEITVRDEGRGIDSEFLPYVFDRFRQEDSSTTRVHGGLGLGLAIVRHIVELHGGMVFAASEGRDLGSTFTIILPVMSAASIENDKERAQENIPASLRLNSVENNKVLKGFTVLVVDDELDTRTLLWTILNRCGADVKVAESASVARGILESWTPDVIISDIGLQEEDGIEFIKKIRAATDKPASEIPAIALTAYAQHEIRDKIIAAGYNAHASKPIGAPHLIEVILRVIVRKGKPT